MPVSWPTPLANRSEADLGRTRRQAMIDDLTSGLQRLTETFLKPTPPAVEPTPVAPAPAPYTDPFATGLPTVTRTGDRAPSTSPASQSFQSSPVAMPTGQPQAAPFELPPPETFQPHRAASPTTGGYTDPFATGLDQQPGQYTLPPPESFLGPRQPADQSGPVSPIGAPSSPAPAGTAAGARPGAGEIESYIRQAAAARGIDPDTAVRVALSEGGLDDPVRQSDVRTAGGREESYGPFQLYLNGGLGNAALQRGIDPRNPAHWKQAIDFSLDEAARGGWGPWHGAARVGIGTRQGLEQARPIGVQAGAAEPPTATQRQTASTVTTGEQPTASGLEAPPQQTLATPHTSGKRPETRGIVVHSTRGNAKDAESEYQATLRWFQGNPSQVSSNAVIGPNGEITYFGDMDTVTHHAGENNSRYYGIELAQTRADQPFTEAQYRSLAWLTKQVSSRYGFTPDRNTLVGHEELEQGKRQGKCIAGETLLAAIVDGRTVFDTADRVLRHDNVLIPCYSDDGTVEWRPVLWKERTRRRVQRVTFHGGNSVITTPEHRWQQVGHRGNLYTGRMGGRARPSILTETRNLSPGATVPKVAALARPPSVVDDGSIYDADLGYLVGAYLAEGSRLKTSDRRLSLGENDRERMIPRLHEVVTGRLHEAWREYPSKTGKGISVHLYGPVTDAIIRKFIVGATSHDKHLHSDTWQQPLVFIEGILDGYLDGDGHWTGERWTVGCADNAALLEDIGFCALLTGRHFYKQRYRRAVHLGEKTHWSRRFGLDGREPRRSAAVADVSTVGGVYGVWDISVGGNGLFVLGNGLVTHNSDPGPTFQWDRYLSMVGQPSPAATAQAPTAPSRTAVSTTTTGEQPTPGGFSSSDYSPSQFDLGLTWDEALAACGPAAAIAFARRNGRNPTGAEALALAREVGWTPATGMRGTASQVTLLGKMGIAAKLEEGVNWEKVRADIQRGNPVIFDTTGGSGIPAGHYFVAQGYDPETGRYDLGGSARALKASGGKTWYTPQEILALGAGSPRNAIFMDNPDTPAPSVVAGQSPSQAITTPRGTVDESEIMAQRTDVPGVAGAAQAPQPEAGFNDPGPVPLPPPPARDDWRTPRPVTPVASVDPLLGQPDASGYDRPPADPWTAASVQPDPYAVPPVSPVSAGPFTPAPVRGPSLAGGVTPPVTPAFASPAPAPAYSDPFATGLPETTPARSGPDIPAAVGRGLQRAWDESPVSVEPPPEVVGTPLEPISRVQRAINRAGFGLISTDVVAKVLQEVGKEFGIPTWKIAEGFEVGLTDFLALPGRAGSSISQGGARAAERGAANPLIVQRLLQRVLPEGAVRAIAPTIEEYPTLANTVVPAAARGLGRLYEAVAPGVGETIREIPGMARTAVRAGTEAVAPTVRRATEFLGEVNRGMQDAPIGNRTFYHGTAGAFDAPDPGKFDPNGLFGPGYYLTSDPRVAGSYSQARAPIIREDTVKDLETVQAMRDKYLRWLAEDPDQPNVVRNLEMVNQQIARLERTLAQPGPNIRAVDVPEGLRMLDADGPAPPELRQAIQDRIAALRARGLGSVLLDDAETASRASSTTGADLWRRLAGLEDPDADEITFIGVEGANRILNAAGYDGIRYSGGKRIPMLDDAGAPIEHDVAIIFPESLPKITNRFSQTPMGAGPTPASTLPNPVARTLGNAATGAVAGGMGETIQAAQEDRPVDPMNLARNAALGSALWATAGRRGRAGIGNIVDVATARTLPIETRIPDEPAFRQAVQRAGGKITPDGIEFNFLRHQKPGQVLSGATRGGVFYEPKPRGSQSRYAGGETVGGPQRIEGPTLVKAPLVLESETNAGMPGAFLERTARALGMDDDEVELVTGIYARHDQYNFDPEAVFAYFEEFGLDPAQADDLISTIPKREWRHAVPEAIIADRARQQGYDSLFTLERRPTALTDEEFAATSDGTKLLEQYRSLTDEWKDRLANSREYAALRREADDAREAHQKLLMRDPSYEAAEASFARYSQADARVARLRDNLVGDLRTQAETLHEKIRDAKRPAELREAMDLREAVYPSPEGAFQLRPEFGGPKAGEVVPQDPALWAKAGLHQLVSNRWGDDATYFHDLVGKIGPDPAGQQAARDLADLLGEPAKKHIDAILQPKAPALAGFASDAGLATAGAAGGAASGEEGDEGQNALGGAAALVLAARFPNAGRAYQRLAARNAAEMAQRGIQTLSPTRWLRGLAGSVGYSAMLGPGTMSVNLAAGLVEPLWAVPKEVTRGVARAAQTRNLAALREPAAMAGGALTGLAHIGDAIKDVMLSRGRYAANPDAPFLSEQTADPLGRLLARALEVPGRAWAGLPDAVFGTVAEFAGMSRKAAQLATDKGLTGNAWKQEYALLLNDAKQLRLGNPATRANEAAEIVDEGIAYGRRQSFRDELGTIGKKVRTYARMGDAPVIGNLVAPFFSTPWNIFLRQAERSPVGLAMNTQRGFDKYYDALIGTGVILAFGNYAAQGGITGSGPSDPKQRRQLEAEGWKPYHTLVNGVYVPNRAFGYAEGVLNAAGELHDYAAYQKKDADDRAKLDSAASRVGKLIKQQPYAAGIASILEIQDFGPISFASDIAARMTPFAATTRTIATAGDTVERQANRGKGVPIEQEVEERWRQTTGYGRSSLPAAQDVLGRDKPNLQQGPWAIAPKLPSKTDEPVVHAFTAAGMTIGDPPDDVALPNAPGVRVPLTPDEQREWNRIRGEALTSLYQSNFGGRGQPTADQLERTRTRARDIATQRILARLSVSEIQRRRRETVAR